MGSPLSEMSLWNVDSPLIGRAVLEAVEKFITAVTRELNEPGELQRRAAELEAAGMSVYPRSRQVGLSALDSRRPNRRIDMIVVKWLGAGAGGSARSCRSP